jgi:hypothetical protein
MARAKAETETETETVGIGQQPSDHYQIPMLFLSLFFLLFYNNVLVILPLSHAQDTVES